MGGDIKFDVIVRLEDTRWRWRKVRGGLGPVLRQVLEPRVVGDTDEELHGAQGL